MTILRTALGAAGEFRKGIALAAAEGVLVALLESFTLLALFNLLNGLLSLEPAASTLARLPLFGAYHGAPVQLAGIVLLAATLRYVLGLHLEWTTSRLWVGIRRHMQRVMFSLHLKARYEFLLKAKAGEHFHHIIEGPAFAAVFYLHLVRLVSTGIMLLVLFATLFLVSPVLMLVALLVAAIYGLAVRRVSNNISFRLGQDQARAIIGLTEVVTESLAGVRYLRTLASTERWIADFDRYGNAAECAMQRAGFWNTVPARTLEFAVLLFFIAIVLWTLAADVPVVASIPTMAIYFLGIVRILPSLSILGNARMQMMHALPNLDRYVELRHTIPPEPVTGGALDVPDLRRAAIVFDNLTFAYGARPVLNGLRLIIEPLRLTVITGPSGHGKSTLLDLLLRFVDAQDGRITVAGRDIREFNLRAWRQRFAYLGQDPFLFHDTVMENIRLGRANATDAEVVEAAKLAGAAEFIAQLPEAWQTVLADRGHSLSGGQRQRIALARALVSQAEVLLFDEPTSALDSENESRVLQTIFGLKGHRTLVMVTHSEKAIAQADRVLVLSDGQVKQK